MKLFKYSRLLITLGQRKRTKKGMNTFEIMERLGRNSRAASLPKEDAIVTEMVDGLIVSRPEKRIEYIGERNEPEPVVIDLQEYAKSKAASVPSINKLKVIRDFMFSNGLR